jgi:hypothetical protein
MISILLEIFNPKELILSKIGNNIQGRTLIIEMELQFQIKDQAHYKRAIKVLETL